MLGGYVMSPSAAAPFDRPGTFLVTFTQSLPCSATACFSGLSLNAFQCWPFAFDRNGVVVLVLVAALFTFGSVWKASLLHAPITYQNLFSGFCQVLEFLVLKQFLKGVFRQLEQISQVEFVAVEECFKL
jgi:hypothetical protein